MGESDEDDKVSSQTHCESAVKDRKTETRRGEGGRGGRRWSKNPTDMRGGGEKGRRKWRESISFSTT